MRICLAGQIAPAAAYFLGDSYLQLNRPQDAIEPLTLAVNWSKTDADAMYKLGMAHSAVKDYPNAVNMFHAATAFVPDFLEAYEAMAIAYDAAASQSTAIMRAAWRPIRRMITRQRLNCCRKPPGKARLFINVGGLG